MMNSFAKESIQCPCQGDCSIYIVLRALLLMSHFFIFKFNDLFRSKNPGELDRFFRGYHFLLHRSPEDLVTIRCSRYVKTVISSWKTEGYFKIDIRKVCLIGPHHESEKNQRVSYIKKECVLKIPTLN